MMQTVAKSMMNAKVPGAIVKIGSTLSKLSRDEWAHLSAAEAGTMHLVHVAAKEWAKWVTESVNLLYIFHVQYRSKVWTHFFSFFKTAVEIGPVG